MTQLVRRLLWLTGVVTVGGLVLSAVVTWGLVAPSPTRAALVLGVLAAAYVGVVAAVALVSLRTIQEVRGRAEEIEAHITAVAAGGNGAAVPRVRDDDLDDVVRAWRRAAKLLRRREEEVKAARAELAEVGARARRTEAQKDTFLHVLRDEVRSPIAEARRLMADLKSTSDGMAEVWDDLALAQQLIDDGLLYANLEGVERLDLTPMDLVPLVKGAVGAVTPHARSKDIAVGATLPPSDTVPAHPLLATALEHLLTHALRRSLRGGDVSIAVVRLEKSAVVRVIDHGRSLLLVERRYLFDEKALGESGEFDPSGLGLPLARRIVGLHGGSLRADETPGGGLTVSLELPREVTFSRERRRLMPENRHDRPVT